MRKVSLSILLLLLISGCATFKPHPKPWTPAEKRAAGFFVIAHLADAWTTEGYLDNPENWETINPALGERPSDQRIAVYFSISGAVALLLSHWYPELRQPLLLGYGSINTSMVIHNQRLD